jgi:uncharacterized membrane protein YkoI
MKRAAISLISGVALLALPASALADDRQQGQEGQREQKETVKVPAQVHETIKSETAGAKITEIDRNEENGEVVYQVEFEHAGRNYEMDVASDGTVLRKDKG